jgi:hypothetical protein
VTSDLTKEEIAFGELVLTGVSHKKAAIEVWPEIRGPDAKAKRVFNKSMFQRWLHARKEITYQTVREITAQHEADYEARITTLAKAFADANLREKLQIHGTLTAEEGRKTAKPKDGILDTNRLAQLVAGAAAFGAGAGPRILDGRLSPLRRELSLDTDEGRGSAEVQPVAPPAGDVERPS